MKDKGDENRLQFRNMRLIAGDGLFTTQSLPLAAHSFYLFYPLFDSALI